MTERYACLLCTRMDLSLTANGRIRSHAANGKRPSPDNPACPGGSDLPRAAGQTPTPVTASGGPNPYRAPLPDHVHQFQWGDDNNGHSGSFCSVCGEMEPDEPAPVYRSPFKRPGHDGEHFAMRADLPHDRNPDEQTEDTWTPSPVPTVDTPAQSSKPGSTASAGTAANPSTKETPSAGTETTSFTRGASMTDVFESAAPARERADQKVERDSYGRYKLHHPATGKKQAWQRATTFAKMLQDQYGLMTWQQRMTAKGLAMRPDLLDLVATLDVKRDREQLNKLLEEAKDVAGSKVAANQGTVVHKHTEDVDFGTPLADIPPRYRADVMAYLDAMKRKQLTTHPHLIERITAVPDLDVAGTLDRIVRDQYGKYRILDVKTGNMDFGQLEIAIQLAVYAAGVKTAGLYDLDTGTWQSPGFRVETDYALVAHIPFGKGTCDILRVPIDLGWEAVQTAAQVRDWRKQKKLFTAYDPEDTSSPYVELLRAEVGDPGTVSVRPPTWEDRAGRVATQSEASSLWKEALSELGQGERLDNLIRVMKVALSG